MTTPQTRTKTPQSTTGYETQLWQMADALRGSMDAAAYKHVGVEAQPDDGGPFEDKMTRLTVQWREQQAEAQRLDAEIEANLARLGFGYNE